MKIHYKVFTLAILISFLFFSCKEGNEATILGKDKLAEVLTDIHVADALMSVKGLYDRKLEDTTQSYYHFILKKHNISRADFESSLEHYNRNIDDFVQIYENIVLQITNKVPRTLHKNSIYTLIDQAIIDGKAKSDLKKHYGIRGKELWTTFKTVNYPEMPANKIIRLKKDIRYQCFATFTTEIALHQDDMSMGLRVEFEIIYADKSKTRIKREIIDNDGKWRTYRMLLKTDPEKTPKSIRGAVIKKYNTADTLNIKVRNLSLRLFAPDTDTSALPKISENAILITENDTVTATERKLAFKRKPTAEPTFGELEDLNLNDLDDEDFNFDVE